MSGSGSASPSGSESEDDDEELVNVGKGTRPSTPPEGGKGQTLEHRPSNLSGKGVSSKDPVSCLLLLDTLVPLESQGAWEDVLINILASSFAYSFGGTDLPFIGYKIFS